MSAGDEQGQLETKALQDFQVKDADRGEVEAHVTTVNVVDGDRHVTVRGAIRNGAGVLLSGYGHDVALANAAPVGRGTITFAGDKGILRARYWLGLARARDAFEVVKQMGSAQAWSIGFRTVRSSAPSPEWAARGAVLMLDELDVVEASPVLLAASQGTATLSAKCTNCGKSHGTACACGSGLVLSQAELAAIDMKIRPGAAAFYAGGSERLDAELAEGRRALGCLPEVQVDHERREWAKTVIGWAARRWHVAAPSVKWTSRGALGSWSGVHYPTSNTIWLGSHLKSEAAIARVAVHECSHHAREVRGLVNTEHEVELDTAELLQTLYAEGLQ